MAYFCSRVDVVYTVEGIIAWMYHLKTLMYQPTQELPGFRGLVQDTWSEV